MITIKVHVQDIQKDKEALIVCGSNISLSKWKGYSQNENLEVVMKI